jgi:hypothetical protein
MVRCTVAAALVVAGLVFAMGLPMPEAHAQSAFESEAVYRASGLVGPDLLKGPRFTVDERVPVKGMLARFTVRSDFGTLEAAGIHMLHVRVREMHALGELEKMSKSKEFAEASARAIARPMTSAGHMLLNPAKTVEGVPGGVTRLFGRMELGSEAIGGAATSNSATDAKTAEVTKRVGSVTADALGYEKERRDLAKKLGVDPYTTNAVLSKKLTDMAWVAFSGRLTVQVATSALVPYSMALSAVTITDSTVYDTPAGDLVNGARAVFAGTGAGDGQVLALVRNPHYSLSVLTALAQGLQRLPRVDGLASVVGLAAAAKSEDESRFVAGAVHMLARHHESVEPFVRVESPAPIVGHAASGVRVAPAPVDSVAWTGEVARFVQRAEVSGPKRIAWVSGQVTPRARKELAAKGWTVQESFSIGAER